MGENTHNAGGPMWDANANAWIYSAGRKFPADHRFSPPMSRNQMADVLQAFQGSPAAWLAAHPAPVRVWLNNRTPAQRADHQTGCVEWMLLRDELCSRNP